MKELSHGNIIKLENVFLRPDKGEVDLVYDYAEVCPDSLARWAAHHDVPLQHDLSDIIRYHRSRGPCDPRVVKSIVYQILKGVAFLHQNWVMHRDLKPANILIAGHGSDECGRVKIGTFSAIYKMHSRLTRHMRTADFGLARIFQQPLRKLAKDGMDGVPCLPR